MVEETITIIISTLEIWGDECMEAAVEVVVDTSAKVTGAAAIIAPPAVEVEVEVKERGGGEEGGEEEEGLSEEEEGDLVVAAVAGGAVITIMTFTRQPTTDLN